jgi:O-antigen/teichoic acid export membrane protein
MYSAFKRTGKEAAIYGIGQGLTKVVAFLLVPLYTRYLTQSDFGKLGLLASINAILGVVVSLGLTSALFRSYYDYDHIRGQRLVISTTLILLGLVVPTAILPAWLLFPSLSNALFGEKASAVFLWLCALKAVAISFQGVPLAVYRARGLAVRFITLTLAGVVLKLAVIVYLVVFYHQGLMGVVAGDAWTSVVATVFMLWTIRADIAPVFSLSEARKMLKFGLPLVPADMGSIIYTRADMFFLNAYANLSVVGQYNAVVLVINAMQMLVLSPFMLVWTPMLLSVAKEKYANIFYARMTIYVLTLVGFLAFALSLFTREVIWIVAGPGYEIAAQVLPILCLAQVFYITQVSFVVGITLERKTQYIPVILGAVVMTTVAANFILVPRLGIVGAGFAGLLSSIAFAALTYTVSRRFYPIKYETLRAVKVMVVFLSGYAVATVLGVFMTGWLFWVIRLVVLSLSIVVLYNLHFFEEDEISVVKQQVQLITRKIGRATRKV